MATQGCQSIRLPGDHRLGHEYRDHGLSSAPGRPVPRLDQFRLRKGVRNMGGVPAQVTNRSPRAGDCRDQACVIRTSGRPVRITTRGTTWSTFARPLVYWERSRSSGSGSEWSTTSRAIERFRDALRSGPRQPGRSSPADPALQQGAYGTGFGIKAASASSIDSSRPGSRIRATRSRRDAGAAVGRSGDGGIDGVIKEDRLGLDAVYIKPSAGRAPSVGRWSRCLPEAWTDRRRRRAC